MGRFVDYLKAHGRISDLAFVSFEHYPFEPCEITWKTLYTEPQLMKHILQVWRDDGVPKDVPLMVTENHLAAAAYRTHDHDFRGAYGSPTTLALSSKAEALLSITHQFSRRGFRTRCLGWASWSNFVSDENYNIKGYTSPYFAAHMINREWVQHRSGVHHMFPSSADIKDS